MGIQNAREQFYNSIKDKSISQELKNIIEEKREDSGFFELCQTYADISLNAPKKVNRFSKTVQGCFLDEDVDEAKYATSKFVDQYEIKDIDGLLQSIELMHGLAVEWDDKRIKMETIYSEQNHFTEPRIGMYYDYCRLPSNTWKSIENEIKQYIQFGEIV